MPKTNSYICIAVISIIFSLCTSTLGQSLIYYDTTFKTITDLIKKDKYPFKSVVFEIENAYQDGNLSKTDFENDIAFLKLIVQSRVQSNRVNYSKSDSNTINTYAAIFKTITDTTKIEIEADSLIQLSHKPFRYNFEDMFGDKNWENMFVTQLLATRKGNCHSMPYLYKILCDELSVPCHLALAPNHIYIKHRSEKAGWYNTELTSASFPVDAWLMASGYITLEAIQNGLYMDTLDNKKCIALCVLDLAKGYDKKYTDNDGAFVLKCCDLALQHFPNCINALLLKAETRKKQIDRLCRLRGIPPSVLRRQNDGKTAWDDMTALYTTIHKLGYRTMPEQMYVDWLLSLQKEREKYSNKQVMEMSR